jgi:enoyl-CoA hydratase/carnithine racemase
MTTHLKSQDQENGVRMLTLSRPPVNALNAAYLSELESAFDKIDKDETVRVLVLNSDLGVFSAGMDLKEALAFSPTEQTAIVDGLNAAYGRLYGVSKPVIVAINRAAIAGGLFFALVADYALADKGAKLGLTEVRVGVDFPVGALEIARAEMSPATFKRILLSGQNVDAAEAQTMGIINEITEPDDLTNRAIEMARDYARIPPIAFASIKAQMRKTVLDRIARVIADKSDPARDGWFTDETVAAMSALLAAATIKT